MSNPPVTLTQQKRLLRQQLLRQRATIPAQTMADLSMRLCQNLAPWIQQGGYEMVLMYSPIRGEIDLRPLARLLPQLAFGMPVLAPDHASMQFAKWHEGTAMVVNRFGIPEPNIDGGADLLVPNARTVVLVPCLAVDASGVRLGYGGGFYDRFLAAHRVTPVGIVLNEGLRARLPEESHDVLLAYVATETALEPRPAV